MLTIKDSYLVKIFSNEINFIINFNERNIIEGYSFEGYSIKMNKKIGTNILTNEKEVFLHNFFSYEGKNYEIYVFLKCIFVDSVQNPSLPYIYAFEDSLIELSIPHFNIYDRENFIIPCTFYGYLCGGNYARSHTFIIKEINTSNNKTANTSVISPLKSFRMTDYDCGFLDDYELSIIFNKANFSMVCYEDQLELHEVCYNQLQHNFSGERPPYERDESVRDDGWDNFDLREKFSVDAERTWQEIFREDYMKNISDEEIERENKKKEESDKKLASIEKELYLNAIIKVNDYNKFSFYPLNYYIDFSRNKKDSALPELKGMNLIFRQGIGRSHNLYEICSEEITSIKFKNEYMIASVEPEKIRQVNGRYVYISELLINYDFHYTDSYEILVLFFWSKSKDIDREIVSKFGELNNFKILTTRGITTAIYLENEFPF